jgi:hypothetical protein
VVTLAALVEAPPLAPPALSLVRAASTPADATGGRWASSGITYTPEAQAEAGIDDACAPAGGTYTHVAPVTVEWIPYSVTAYDECSALSAGARDYAGRARRAVENATPKAVELEFWGGAFATAASLPNRYLAKAAGAGGPTVLNPTPGTAVSFKRAVRLLEQHIADTGFGTPGMIHCRPEAIDDQAVTLVREGNLLRTLLGTIVVPGAGYPGTGPAGDTNDDPPAGKTWIYATGLVQYRQTDVEIPGWTANTMLRDVIDRADNTVTVYGWRTALASWDGVVHGAVYADLPT